MDWLEKFEEELKQTGKSQNTIISYCTDIKEFLKWFSDTYAKEFDGRILEQDVREYRNYLLNIAKLKPSSINRKMAALKNFNQFLIQTGTGIEADICGISVADIHDREIRTISRNELNRLKRAVYASGNKRDIALIELLIGTGVRVSELVSLTTEDIHLTARNGKENYSYIVIRNGKGNKYREIPLNSQVKKALEEYLVTRSHLSGRIFIGQRGPLRRESVDKIIKKYCRMAGIEEISAHVLRHTFCTRLMSENVPIPIISKLAGHSSIQTTMDFYVRVSRADKTAAVEKLT
ncbi:tyrosine-type recombinase/integrase [Thermoanaerobacter wiegelii]|uniref:Integrase family protein n=1 Tax=Thermoanaerobacter wiegelii Rt8.B1 TaxID=697303 RepID=G2MTX0_9THEO|nr:tyrosine-type recombinase/integrase [Thermoanaerobacter wiegelii]AEM79505.1 integrase family protein [Thermoanaerobacter wiegelii Rt8.B1]